MERRRQRDRYNDPEIIIECKHAANSTGLCVCVSAILFKKKKNSRVVRQRSYSLGSLQSAMGMVKLEPQSSSIACPGQMDFAFRDVFLLSLFLFFSLPVSLSLSRVPNNHRYRKISARVRECSLFVRGVLGKFSRIVTACPEYIWYEWEFVNAYPRNTRGPREPIRSGTLIKVLDLTCGARSRATAKSIALGNSARNARPPGAYRTYLGVLSYTYGYANRLYHIVVVVVSSVASWTWNNAARA